MDWSELKEQFDRFDRLVESLCNEFQIDLNDDYHQLNESQIDLSDHKENNLVSYTVLMPNQLRPVTYANVTNQLLNELLKDKWFKDTGTLLRTLEKGVFHPVLHYSTIHNKNKKYENNLIELFKPSKLGKNYTLYQAIYEELYTFELPVVTKKVSKMKSNNLNDQNVKKKKSLENTIHNNEENENKFHSFDYLSVDYLSIDSGCASLNSTCLNATTNDYNSLDDESKTTKRNTSDDDLESFELFYDSSNDSLLNSSQQTTFRKQNCSTKLTDHLISNNLMNNSLNTSNQLKYSNFYGNLNDGHVVIGFRIKDEFFRHVFERNWQEMTGARFFSNLVAAKFGLNRLRFLKRVALNTKRKGREHDDGTTFTYLLHVEFLNLTSKNEIYLTNLVHRLRLRTIGSINFYTNLSSN